MKFDVVVGNPPYQSDNKNNPLWQQFVKITLGILKPNGYMSLVHPSAWRKPNHNILELLKGFDMVYLEIHNAIDGKSIFGVSTRYDWYTVRNSISDIKTEVVDELGHTEFIDLKSAEYVFNTHMDFLKNITTKSANTIKILHSRSMYGNDKNWMSMVSDDTHMLPCIHSTPANGIPKLLYSSKNNGHFGIKKIIFGKASPENAIFDREGKYGVTNNCFAIEVTTELEGDNIIKAVNTDKFRQFVSNCKWAGFSFEYKVMLGFKKDFWKEFIC